MLILVIDDNNPDKTGILLNQKDIVFLWKLFIK